LQLKTVEQRHAHVVQVERVHDVWGGVGTPGWFHWTKQYDCPTTQVGGGTAPASARTPQQNSPEIGAHRYGVPIAGPASTDPASMGAPESGEPESAGAGVVAEHALNSPSAINAGTTDVSRAITFTIIAQSTHEGRLWGLSQTIESTGE
jgi:hypothetical protein